MLLRVTPLLELLLLLAMLRVILYMLIGEQSRIQGNIIAANAEINGKVNGNLSIQDVLTLKATSNIEGDIATQVLIIEPKAVFNGSCKMQDSKRAGKEGK